METEEEKLKTPDGFEFPFPPYEPQTLFMKKLYETLEEGKLGIFESPTGTGKSLALICGALRWLRDHEARQLSAAEAAVQRLQLSAQPSAAAAAPDDWLTQQGADRERRQLLQLAEKQLAAIHRARVLPKAERRGFGAQSLERQKEEFRALFGDEAAAESEDQNCDEADLLLDDVDSDADEEDTDDEEESPRTQIIYTSRTHSQLSQFVGEVRRSPHSAAVRVAALASRPQLCINDAVRRLQSVSLINQACLDLQQKPAPKTTWTDADGARLKKQKAAAGCPYKRGADQLSAQVLSEVRDIEQLVELGRKKKACPYYASRKAVKHAQLVVVPYNNLLHSATRDASGLRLKGSVVIVDEAHNLLETINGIHSCQLSRRQLSEAVDQLEHYINSYRTRFSPKNLLSLKQLLFVHKGILRLIDNTEKQPAPGAAAAPALGVAAAGPAPGAAAPAPGAAAPAPGAAAPAERTKVLTLIDFVCGAGIDNLNLHQLMVFAERSRLAQKLRGCWRRRQVNSNTTRTTTTGSARASVSAFLRELQTPAAAPAPPADAEHPTADEKQRGNEMPLMATLQLISALSQPSSDCKLLITTTRVEPPVVKFLALNAAAQFRSVIQEARAVILAGGTMQPVSEFRDQLFGAAGAPPQRVQLFSCGHVVPPEQLLPLSLGSGPSGAPLNFSFQRRAAKETLDELGRLLLGVCRLVPDGVVCFLPSYEYAAAALAHLTATGALQKIAARKQVFREPRQSSRAEAVLAEYSRAVTGGRSRADGSTTTGGRSRADGSATTGGHSRADGSATTGGRSRADGSATTGGRSRADGSATTGALLFCVVGGKMSEGINFSNELGRCVIVVGLPYPNAHSPELLEKMRFLDATVARSPDGRTPGQVLYENLCMKAVNQSIGRAIRHRDDYACVLLCDERYGRASTSAGLPGWIRQRLQHQHSFGPALALIRKFFVSMESKFAGKK